MGSPYFLTHGQSCCDLFGSTHGWTSTLRHFSKNSPVFGETRVVFAAQKFRSQETHPRKTVSMGFSFGLDYGMKTGPRTHNLSQTCLRYIKATYKEVDINIFQLGGLEINQEAREIAGTAASLNAHLGCTENGCVFLEGSVFFLLVPFKTIDIKKDTPKSDCLFAATQHRNARKCLRDYDQLLLRPEVSRVARAEDWLVSP